MRKAIFTLLFTIPFLLSAQTNRFNEAAKLYDTKQYAASITICTNELRQLSLKDSMTCKFLFLRANNYLHINKVTESVDDCKKLIALQPGNTSNYLNLSYVYGEFGYYKQCIDILHQALTIDPKDIYVYNSLSYYSFRSEKFEDAIRFANEGLKYVKEPYWKGALLNNRGSGYIGLERYSEALDDINEGLKLNPDNSFAYVYRALANIGQKKMTTVCDDLNKAKALGGITLTDDLIKRYCQ